LTAGPSRLPLVLVPGACLGGWAWREVATSLRAYGHEVYPVTLTGLGERVHLADHNTDLDTHIADVVNLLDYEALERVVLVGHSYAGIVITGVADRRPERLHTLVYLDTSPLPDGMAIADAQSPEQREQQRRAVAQHGDGRRWPVPDRQVLETGMFGSAGGLTDSHFALIEKRGTPQPYATFTSPLRLAHEAPPDLRRAAILCTEGGFDVAMVRELIAREDPRAAVFADAEWQFHELPTGHWAMFSAPGPLAELLHRIASPSDPAGAT
jgi:pimeloyl-ACP methyl ester carboxylesterase